MANLTRRDFIKATSAFLPAVIAGQVFSDSIAVSDSLEPLINVTLNMAHKGTLEIDMQLLESYQKQSKSIVEFFKTIHAEAMYSPSAAFADNPAVLKACEKYNITHLGGPMLGDLRPDGVSVWLRTIKPAQVAVITACKDGKKKIFGPKSSSVENDLTVVVPIQGLEPDTIYDYEIYIDGKKLQLNRPAQFRTAPEQFEEKIFHIAFGSCFHKSGVHNIHLLKQIKKQGSQAMLLLGDSAVDDRENNLARHRTDYLLRDLSPAWQNLSASVPIYAAWDDHDYFNNDLSGIPRKKYTIDDVLAVRNIWRQNWNNPSCGEDGQGIYFRTRIGPADLIMLDTRSLRKEEKLMKNAYLGDKQADWLKCELLKCKGPFVILSSGTMWSDYISNGKDSWGLWDPAGREEIFQFIEDNKIPGVLLISGDRHGARGVKIARPSGYHFYEFEPACLGGMTGPQAWGSDKNMQLFGHTKIKAFGQFEFDCRTSDPSVTFRLIDQTGNTLEKITLSQSQLTPK